MAQRAATSSSSPAQRLEVLISRFEPAVGTVVRAARTKMRKRFPAALELVYDNYNALAIGYATSERKNDIFVSLAVYARGVNLYFMYGVALADPHRLLLGTGNQGRFLRLESASMLERPEVQALLVAAVGEVDTPLAMRGRWQTIIKSVSPNPHRRRSRGTEPVR
jgi:hypothetical protein